jgi:hypothetical protein
VADAPAVNNAKAGSSTPIKFSLGGDRGMDILYGGSPWSRPVDCDTLAPTGPVEAARAAGRSGLQYDAGDDEYTYVWKTAGNWAGSCRELALGLDDGTSYSAYFRFS